MPADDPLEPIDALLRDLDAGVEGLSTAEAARRLARYGPNELTRAGRRRWWAELARQVTHPLALLLWLAAELAAVAGTLPLSYAIVGVIAVNAALAMAQKRQAERAVEALAAYLPERATVLRDGVPADVDARELVPGDVVLIEEGDRVCADARLLRGAVEVDLSTFNGESVPALRSADLLDAGVPLLDARDLVFSGTSCTGGRARAIVFATGMRTQWAGSPPSPSGCGSHVSAVDAGARLHHTWRQATTMTFLGIVACQVGTAFAARTHRAPLRSVGLTTNRLLLWGIAFEIAFAAAVVVAPPLQRVFGTAVPPLPLLAVLLPFPVLVWGCDEVWRWWRRRRGCTKPYNAVYDIQAYTIWRLPCPAHSRARRWWCPGSRSQR